LGISMTPVTVAGRFSPRETSCQGLNWDTWKEE